MKYRDTFKINKCLWFSNEFRLHLMSQMPEMIRCQIQRVNVSNKMDLANIFKYFPVGEAKSVTVTSQTTEVEAR